MPRVSIVLPVYNGGRFIEKAVKSVQSQSFRDWELCVVDDGSTDGTQSIVEHAQAHDTRIRYARNDRNLGIQKTLNKGLAMAQGMYVARIDADDQWIDFEKLSGQVAFLDKHGDYALVGTGAVVTDEHGKELSRFLNPETDVQIRHRILGKNCFTHSSVLFRADAARELKGYDEKSDARHVEDYDLWLRMGRKWKFANLPLYGVSWTLLASGLGSQNKLEQFVNAFAVSRRYRDAYPYALAGQARHAARIMLYWFFSLIPGAKARTACARLWTRAFKRAL